MSLVTQIQTLATRIATEFNTLRGEIKTLSRVTIPLAEVGDKVILIDPSIAYTATRLTSILTAGTSTPSVSYDIYKGTNPSSGGTKLVTAGVTIASLSTPNVITSFDSASIADTDFVWAVLTAVAGTDTGVYIGLKTS